MSVHVIFLIVFFAIFIPLGIFASKKIRGPIEKYSIVTTGKIIGVKPYDNLTQTYYVELEYTYNGQTYREFTSNASPSRQWNSYLEIGAETRMYLNPDNPKDIYCGKHIHGMGLKGRQ